MSQAGSINVSSSPSVPTTFATDSGNAIPALNILNMLGNDTIVDNENGIQIAGSGSTVTVELTNRLQGTGSAIGAVTEDLITFTLDASNPKVYRFEFLVTGRDTSTGDGVGYTLDGSAKCDGAGTASVIGAPFIDSDEDASLVGASLDLVSSGNDIILQATGVAGQTISYSAVGNYVVI